MTPHGSSRPKARRATVLARTTTCVTDLDPLFVDPGQFDFGRTPRVAICGETVDLPDFLFLGGDRHVHAAPAAPPRTCVRIIDCPDGEKCP